MALQWCLHVNVDFLALNAFLPLFFCHYYVDVYTVSVQVVTGSQYKSHPANLLLFLLLGVKRGASNLNLQVFIMHAWYGCSQYL